MNQYTIYCTQEQTKKALELGAPIHRIPIGGRDGSKPSYFTKQPDEEGWAECPAYYIPTAEQMIGFLRENRLFIEVMMNDTDAHKHFDGLVFINTTDEVLIGHEPKETYKEATLAAIDAALDYLMENKKKLWKKVEGFKDKDEAEVKCAFMSLWTNHALGISTYPVGSAWCNYHGDRKLFDEYMNEWMPLFMAFKEWANKQR